MLRSPTWRPLMLLLLVLEEQPPTRGPARTQLGCPKGSANRLAAFHGDDVFNW